MAGEAKASTDRRTAPGRAGGPRPPIVRAGLSATGEALASTRSGQFSERLALADGPVIRHPLMAINSVATWLRRRAGVVRPIGRCSDSPDAERSARPPSL